LTKPKGNGDGTLMRQLEKAVRDVLKDKDASAADKLRAIETGAKLLQIKHRISAGGGEDGGREPNYFGS
jgi:hypothetical protein